MIRITGNYTYTVSRKSGLYKLAVVKLELIKYCPHFQSLHVNLMLMIISSSVSQCLHYWPFV